MLVNNAGITRDTTLHRMKPEQWNAVINTNLNSLFNMCRQVTEGMRERKFGRNYQHFLYQRPEGSNRLVTNHSAAKAGEIGFTKAWRRRRAWGSRSTICPGYINTEMAAVPKDVLEKIIAQIPVGRLGEPDDIARCVCWPPHADFITGATLNVNGAQYLAKAPFKPSSWVHSKPAHSKPGATVQPTSVQSPRLGRRAKHARRSSLWPLACGEVVRA